MEFRLINALVGELLEIYSEARRTPFPYTGCRTFLHEGNESYEALIPDLDMYFYSIASHSGGVKKILKWPKEKLLEAEETLGRSFFEQHPKYRSLEPMITESNTPDLYTKMVLYEKMRSSLLTLFSLLLSNANNK